MQHVPRTCAEPGEVGVGVAVMRRALLDGVIGASWLALCVGVVLIWFWAIDALTHTPTALWMRVWACCSGAVVVLGCCVFIGYLVRTVVDP